MKEYYIDATSIRILSVDNARELMELLNLTLKDNTNYTSGNFVLRERIDHEVIV